MYLLKVKEIITCKGSVHGRTLRFFFKDREDLQEKFRKYNTGLWGTTFILNNFNNFNEGEEYIRFVPLRRGELDKYHVYTLKTL